MNVILTSHIFITYVAYFGANDHRSPLRVGSSMPTPLYRCVASWTRRISLHFLIWEWNVTVRDDVTFPLAGRLM